MEIIGYYQYQPLKAVYREFLYNLGPWAPGARRVRFLFFHGAFKGPEWSHDVPGPPAINFAFRNAQNDGMRVSFDQFSTFLDKSSPQFPNSFRKSRSHMASQAKVLQGKLSYTDPLHIRFSSKVADLLVYTCFRELFLKNLFFVLRRLRPVSF